MMLSNKQKNLLIGKRVTFSKAAKSVREGNKRVVEVFDTAPRTGVVTGFTRLYAGEYTYSRRLNRESLHTLKSFTCARVNTDLGEYLVPVGAFSLEGKL